MSEDLFLLYVFVCVSVDVDVCVWHGVIVEAGRQLEVTCALLLLCGSQGLNPGPQTWQQVHLPAETSYQP